MPVIERPTAALPLSHHLTGTVFGRDPAVLISRRGGTDEFLGRGAWPRSRSAGNGGAADPWKSVWCSRVLTPLAEPVRRSRERAGSRAVPVVTPRKKEISAPVHRPYLDRRGHKRVRRPPPSLTATARQPPNRTTPQPKRGGFPNRRSSACNSGAKASAKARVSASGSIPRRSETWRLAVSSPTEK